MSPLPGRFLALVAHLGMVLRMGGDPPKDLTGEPEAGFWGALGGSLALLGLEFLGFLSGVSMFNSGQNLGSLAAHSGAALALALGFLGDFDSLALWASLALSIPSLFRSCCCWFGSFCATEGGSDWEILGDTGRYWEILGDTGRYWEILGGNWEHWERVTIKLVLGFF